jgi:hypothetical protein
MYHLWSRSISIDLCHWCNEDNKDTLPGRPLHNEDNKETLVRRPLHNADNKETLQRRHYREDLIAMNTGRYYRRDPFTGK